MSELNIQAFRARTMIVASFGRYLAELATIMKQPGRLALITIQWRAAVESLTCLQPEATLRN